MLNLKQMKISIMQPYFLPYINYFKLISKSNKFLILNDVNYPKKKFVNRNSFTLNGNLEWALPVSKISQNKKIKDHYFHEFNNNKIKLKKIFFNYLNSYQFFDQTLLDKLFLSTNERVDLFIKDSISIICDYLDIETEILLTSELKNINDNGQDKILNICEYYQASEYLNLPSGKNLYNADDFLKKNIKLKFISELDNNFSSSSILDVIFFYGKKSVINFLRH